MKRLSLAILILNFTFITSYAQSVDSLRNKALYWAERGYYARSLDMISQIPSDSLCINDMRMHYDALSNLGHEDSLEYWADKILRQDPYCTPVIIDYTRRLNRGLKTETGQVRNSDRVIEMRSIQATRLYPHTYKPPVSRCLLQHGKFRPRSA